MHATDKQFKDNWAIILGGSSGFGFATVQKLAMHGMNVTVIYRETAAAERTLKETLNKIAVDNGVIISPYNINALDNTARAVFIEQFAADNKDNVKLLLHSIARGNLKPLTGEDALSIADVQLTTYAMGTSLIDWVRDLLAANAFCSDARIIGLTSEGEDKYWEGYAAVSIAKASLQSLTKYMAVELAQYGLRTNLIQAGITPTPSLKRIPESDKLIDHAASRNPFGRMTEPADVANVIYLLCTDEAAWINGTVIHVDGGEHCK